MAADLVVDVRMNGNVPNAKPLEVAYGSDLKISYEVRNTGVLAYRNLTIKDDAGTLDLSDDFAPNAISTSGKGVGELGDLLATYWYLNASRFIQHPTKPLMYASVKSHDSIAVINTDTLKLEALIPIGYFPTGMAITDDGAKLYVANTKSNYVAVLNTETLQVEPKLFFEEPPHDVEVASDGSLIVLGYKQLKRIDPSTGKLLEWLPVYANYGELAMSPQKDRLYYGDTGITPSKFYVFDMTTKPVSIFWKSPHGEGFIGGSGLGVTLSHDGTFVSFVTGGGQLGSQIAKFNTSNMAIEGGFNTGSHPREIAFSPDDTVAYTIQGNHDIETWDTNFFTNTGTIRTLDRATELWVDRTGRYLFAGFENEIRVYSTGRSVGVQVNVGDTNGNGNLDPGETWRFEKIVKAGTGLHPHRVAVAATGSDNESTFSTSVATYFGILSAKVKGNIKGVEAIIVPESQTTIPDDSRFEVVNNILRTKLDEQLDASVEPAIRVRLLDEVTRDVLQIVDLTVHDGLSPWHNQSNPMDVSEDGQLTPLDALLVVNYLNLHSPHKLEDLPEGIAPKIDCNADGFASPLDVLLVVNALNRRGEGEYLGDDYLPSLTEQELDLTGFCVPVLSEPWLSWPDSAWERTKGRRQ